MTYEEFSERMKEVGNGILDLPNDTDIHRLKCDLAMKLHHLRLDVKDAGVEVSPNDGAHHGE